jgi:hypothetical protein
VKCKGGDALCNYSLYIYMFSSFLNIVYLIRFLVIQYFDFYSRETICRVIESLNICIQV